MKVFDHFFRKGRADNVSIELQDHYKYIDENIKDECKEYGKTRNTCTYHPFVYEKVTSTQMCVLDFKKILVNNGFNFSLIYISKYKGNFSDNNYAIKIRGNSYKCSQDFLDTVTERFHIPK